VLALADRLRGVSDAADDKPAAQVIRRIFVLRCQGLGYRKITAMLNADRILPPRDYYYEQLGRPNPTNDNHLWNEVTMREILRNEVYAGHMVQMKTGTRSYKSKGYVNKPREEWVRVESTHEPIIDSATWELCQDITEKNYRYRTTKNGNVTGPRNRPKLLLLMATVFLPNGELDMGVRKRTIKLFALC